MEGKSTWEQADIVPWFGMNTGKKNKRTIKKKKNMCPKENGLLHSFFSFFFGTN